MEKLSVSGLEDTAKAGGSKRIQIYALGKGGKRHLFNKKGHWHGGSPPPFFFGERGNQLGD